MRKLVGAPWPGNVRQLRNEVMRMAACASLNVIGEDDLWEGIPGPGRDQPATQPVRLQSLKKAVAEMEQRMIGEALRETRSNQQQAARLLGLSRQGLINKMKRYCIAG
jgi:DNA-binding NtrC family response regulator